MEWIKTAGDWVKKTLSGLVPSPVGKALAALLAVGGGGAGITIAINSNNRTTNSNNRITALPPPPNPTTATPITFPKGVTPTPYRRVENVLGSAEFRLVPLTDGNRWLMGSETYIETANGKVHVKDAIHRVSDSLISDVQALVVLGVASREGTDKSEMQRATKRADLVTEELRPFARRGGVKIHSAVLGRYIGEEGVSDTSGQRRLVVLQAKGAPSVAAIKPLTKRYLETATDGEKLILNPRTYSACRDGCGELAVVDR